MSIVGVDLHGLFFFSSRRRHTRCSRDWSSDVCSSDLVWHLRREGIAETMTTRSVAVFAVLSYAGVMLWLGRRALARFQVTGDRKSTRLNSSHGYISYAVFCLKKKKSRYCISVYSVYFVYTLRNMIVLRLYGQS